MRVRQLLVNFENVLLDRIWVERLWIVGFVGMTSRWYGTVDLRGNGSGT